MGTPAVGEPHRWDETCGTVFPIAPIEKTVAIRDRSSDQVCVLYHSLELVGLRLNGGTAYATDGSRAEAHKVTEGLISRPNIRSTEKDQFASLATKRFAHLLGFQPLIFSCVRRIGGSSYYKIGPVQTGVETNAGI